MCEFVRRKEASDQNRLNATEAECKEELESAHLRAQDKLEKKRIGHQHFTEQYEILRNVLEAQMQHDNELQRRYEDDIFWAQSDVVDMRKEKRDEQLRHAQWMENEKIQFQQNMADNRVKLTAESERMQAEHEQQMEREHAAFVSQLTRQQEQFQCDFEEEQRKRSLYYEQEEQRADEKHAHLLHDLRTEYAQKLGNLKACCSSLSDSEAIWTAQTKQKYAESKKNMEAQHQQNMKEGREEWERKKNEVRKTCQEYKSQWRRYYNQ